MMEQHSYTGDYTNRFKFNGKELDEETGFYYYGARYYNPKFSIWLSVDPLAEKFPSWNPYNYCMDNPINIIDPDGKSPKGTDPPFGFRISAGVSYGSGGFAFNISGSVGVQHRTPSFQGQAFLTGNVYMGGNQLGTSSMTSGVQYDVTLTGLLTTGVGRGQAHNMYSVNFNMASPFANDFQFSTTYGQALSYNSAVNSQWDANFGKRIQRSGILGQKVGNFSFQTANDTGKIGGDDGDRGNTGSGVQLDTKISQGLMIDLRSQNLVVLVLMVVNTIKLNSKNL